MEGGDGDSTGDGKGDNRPRLAVMVDAVVALSVLLTLVNEYERQGLPP